MYSFSGTTHSLKKYQLYSHNNEEDCKYTPQLLDGKLCASLAPTGAQMTDAIDMVSHAGT